MSPRRLYPKGEMLRENQLKAVQQGPENPADKAEEYWTPERLRKAKPLELPHPAEPPKAVTPPSGQGRSVTGSGDSGAGSVPPEQGVTPRGR